MKQRKSRVRISACLAGMHIFAFLCASSILVTGCKEPDPSEQLKPLVEKYVHAWNTGDFKGLDEVVSPQFELRMTPRFDPVKSFDSLKNAITGWRTAYPDFTIMPDEVIYAKDRVAARWTIHATITDQESQPPIKKSIVVPGMSILHFSTGKIIDEWVSSNDLYWFEQLGFTIVPPSRKRSCRYETV
jgi:hypothetical protein